MKSVKYKLMFYMVYVLPDVNISLVVDAANLQVIKDVLKSEWNFIFRQKDFTTRNKKLVYDDHPI